MAASDGVGTGRLLADVSPMVASLRHSLLSMIRVHAVGWLVAKIVLVFWGPTDHSATLANDTDVHDTNSKSHAGRACRACGRGSTKFF